MDKYVEFDAVLLLLDVLLLRVQSYRHLLFNYHITTSVSVRGGLQNYIPTLGVNYIPTSPH